MALGSRRRDSTDRRRGGRLRPRMRRARTSQKGDAARAAATASSSVDGARGDGGCGSDRPLLRWSRRRSASSSGPLQRTKHLDLAGREMRVRRCELSSGIPQHPKDGPKNARGLQGAGPSRMVRVLGSGCSYPALNWTTGVASSVEGDWEAVPIGIELQRSRFIRADGLYRHTSQRRSASRRSNRPKSRCSPCCHQLGWTQNGSYRR